MSRRETRVNGAVVAAVLVVAALLRAYGLRWGLPEVFEEATPMRQAWGMWGWGGRPFDPNPHFFNYPTLVIYIQLLGQAVLFLGMKAFGSIASTLDFRTLYAVDKSAFVLTARTLTAAFGVATVGVTYALVRCVAGKWAALIAGVLLAINVVHIDNSQMVDVDVPLTFFCMLTLWACVRFVELPSRRRYLLAGICVGLAASAKYTGALLAVAVVVAHVSASRRNNGAAPSWTLLVSAGVASIVAFVATSPFVLLDFPTFVQQFSVERYHMEAGHFGLEGVASWRAYAGWLAGDALGWPIVVAGCAGLVYLVGVARRPWAMVVASFALVYAVAVASWNMHAQRYILPLIPVMVVFAAAAVAEASTSRRLMRMGKRMGAAAGVVGALALAAPLVAAFPSHADRHHTDPRTRAREWVESNVPGGSFIVTEAYGPHLFSPSVIWKLDDDVRRRVFSARSSRPYYAVQELPIYQVDPERSGVFYDALVLAMADVFITSDAVRGRYERDAQRFSREIAFYRMLDTTCDLAAEFPGGDGGFGLRVYRSRVQRRPFAQRSGEPAPRPLATGLPAAPGAQERFYFHFGINYEAFNQFAGAYQCYESAFRYSVDAPFLFADVSMGMARCLDALGQRDRAVELLSRVLAAAASDDDRARIRHLQSLMSSR